jgi:hypothetical protein
VLVEPLGVTVDQSTVKESINGEQGEKSDARTARHWGRKLVGALEGVENLWCR